MSGRRPKFTIFISYARPNADAARTLYTQLREARLDPWIDQENLCAGSEWKTVIEHALREAKVVLIWPVFVKGGMGDSREAAKVLL